MTINKFINGDIIVTPAIYKLLMFVSLLIAYPLSTTIGIGGGRGIYYYEVFFYILLTIFFLKRIIGPMVLYGKSNINFGLVERLMLLFIGWVLLGYIVKYDSLSGNMSFLQYGGLKTEMLELKLYASGLLSLIICFGAYVIGRNLFHSKSDFRRIIWIILIASTISSYFVVITWYQQTQVHIGRYNFIPPGDLGYGGLAGIGLTGVLLAMALLHIYRRDNKKILIVLLLLINITSVLVLGVRAIYGYAVFKVILLSILLKPIIKKSYWSTTGIVSLFIIGIVYKVINSNPDILYAITDLFQSNSYEIDNKISMINTAWTIFYDNPIFGVGLGFYSVFNKIPFYVSGIERFVASPHNGVLQLISETGLVGFLIAICITILIVKQTYKTYKILLTPYLKIVAGFILVLVVTGFIGQIVQSSGFFPPSAQRDTLRLSFYLWFLAGYTQSFYKLDKG